MGRHLQRRRITPDLSSTQLLVSRRKDKVILMCCMLPPVLQVQVQVKMKLPAILTSYAETSKFLLMQSINSTGKQTPTMRIDILIPMILDLSTRQTHKEIQQQLKTSHYINLIVQHSHWKKKLPKQKLICKLQKAICSWLIHTMQQLLANLAAKVITRFRNRPLIHLFNTISRSKGALCQMLQL